jgi:hypothetical protein
MIYLSDDNEAAGKLKNTITKKTKQTSHLFLF